jgi:hypothetical protein
MPGSASALASARQLRGTWHMSSSRTRLRRLGPLSALGSGRCLCSSLPPRRVRRDYRRVLVRFPGHGSGPRADRRWPSVTCRAAGQRPAAALRIFWVCEAGGREAVRASETQSLDDFVQIRILVNVADNLDSPVIPPGLIRFVSVVGRWVPAHKVLCPLYGELIE